MNKSTIFNWILTVSGYWVTPEGFALSSLDEPAPMSHCWYRFNGVKFLARGCFQAQLYAEKLIMENSNDDFMYDTCKKLGDGFVQKSKPDF